MKKYFFYAFCFSLFFLMVSCNKKITSVEKLKQENTYSVTYEGISRKFSLYLPQTEETDTNPYPLIMMLHGYGNTSQSFRSRTEMEKFALPKGVAVCYVSSGNDPGWNFTGDKSKKNDAAFLKALALYIQKNYNCDPKNTFLCGFSNGAFMTGLMALKYPESFSGFICVSGLPTLKTWEEFIHDPKRNRKNIPLMLVYGTEDDVIPFRSAGKNVQYNFPFIEDVISHFESSAKSRLNYIQIEKGHHQWPEARTTGFQIDELILDFMIH